MEIDIPSFDQNASIFFPDSLRDNSISQLEKSEDEVIPPTEGVNQSYQVPQFGKGYPKRKERFVSYIEAPQFTFFDYRNTNFSFSDIGQIKEQEQIQKQLFNPTSKQDSYSKQQPMHSSQKTSTSTPIPPSNFNNLINTMADNQQNNLNYPTDFFSLDKIQILKRPLGGERRQNMQIKLEQAEKQNIEYIERGQEELNGIIQDHQHDKIQKVTSNGRSISTSPSPALTSNYVHQIHGIVPQHSLPVNASPPQSYLQQVGPSVFHPQSPSRSPGSQSYPPLNNENISPRSRQLSNQNLTSTLFQDKQGRRVDSIIQDQLNSGIMQTPPSFRLSGTNSLSIGNSSSIL
ncbi:MAG: hypothetical protein EZS28_049903, partial [Streblomastix strix]